MQNADISMTMPTSLSLKKGRVLCVDDEPHILRALYWLLQKDFEVITATSGQEGIARIQQQAFDVVISDQRMPEMGGVEFLTMVKTLTPRSMRFLLTGYADLPALLSSINEAEVYRYITKPWDVDDLPRMIAQAADIARAAELPSTTRQKAIVSEGTTGAAPILVLDNCPTTLCAVQAAVQKLAEVIQVSTVADAVHVMRHQAVSVLISETALGTADLIPPLCLIRQRHPQVVAVLLSRTISTDSISALINQGQIFRFLSKPIDDGQLGETLIQALKLNRQLTQDPGLQERYRTEPLTAQSSHLDDARLSSVTLADATGGTRDESLGQRVGRLVRSLFPSNV